MLHYRNLATVMGASLLLQISFGVLAVSLPLAMSAYGWSGTMIGIVLASYGAGFMIGAYLAPRAIQAVGHIRAYAAFAGMAAALTLLLALDGSIIWWALTRLGFGICAAGIFAVAESWIADGTPPENRGSVIAVYQVLGRAGLILGPFFIAFPGIDLVDSFILAGVFLALALVPVTATRRGEPSIPQGEWISPMRLFEVAPAAALASFVAGMVNSGVLGFLPIWAQGLDGIAMSRSAAITMAFVYAFSMLVQWPIGRYSDHLDRRLVMAACAGAAGGLALILAIFVDPGLWAGATIAGLWGAASLAYYALGVAHAADRSRVEELPAIASGVLMVWAAGSIIGPLIAGVVFASPLGGRGLFMYAAFFSFLLCAALIWRARRRPAVAEEEREPFVNLMATSAELAEIESDAETVHESQGL